MSENAVYITNDRDLPDEDQGTLVIFPGENEDWYVQVAPRKESRLESEWLAFLIGSHTQNEKTSTSRSHVEV